jgi:pilus assembly protein CpaB
MNIRKLLIGVMVAFVVSGSLVFVLYKKIQSGNNNAVKVEHVWHYIAAKRNIAAGESLSATMMTSVDWSSPVPVEGALTSSEKGLGRIVNFPIASGMVITERMLATEGSSYGLPQKIPDGMRAIAIKTDDISDLGGFLFPGSHVDVLLTLQSGVGGEVHSAAGQDGGNKTVVVLENTEVLSTGTELVADPSDKPTTVSVVNLLVSADDARKVALAEAQGAVHLVLRNSGDAGNANHKVTYLSDIMGTPERIPAHAIKKDPKQELQMILGPKSYTETYRDNIPVGESATPAGGGLQK